MVSTSTHSLHCFGGGGDGGSGGDGGGAGGGGGGDGGRGASGGSGGAAGSGGGLGGASMHTTDTSSAGPQLLTPHIWWRHSSSLLSLPWRQKTSSSQMRPSPAPYVAVDASAVPLWPSWRQATAASLFVKPSSQTVPQ